MKEIENNKTLIAYCGLYCGACKAFLKEKCQGCLKNEKASWCKIRTCCIDNNYLSCADCTEFSNIMECKKFNNFMSKLFGFIFRSDRKACINLIKEIGYDNYATKMSKEKLQSLKKE